MFRTACLAKLYSQLWKHKALWHLGTCVSTFHVHLPVNSTNHSEVSICGKAFLLNISAAQKGVFHTISPQLSSSESLTCKYSPESRGSLAPACWPMKLLWKLTAGAFSSHRHQVPSVSVHCDVGKTITVKTTRLDLVRDLHMESRNYKWIVRPLDCTRLSELWLVLEELGLPYNILYLILFLKQI